MVYWNSLSRQSPEIVADFPKRELQLENGFSDTKLEVPAVGLTKLASLGRGCAQSRADGPDRFRLMLDMVLDSIPSMDGGWVVRQDT